MIIAVGKVKEGFLRQAVDSYLKRIKHYARVEEIEIKDGKPQDVTNRFFKAIPKRSRIVALEIKGRSFSSESFAELIGRFENSSVQSLVFLIGGSYGLPKDLIEVAHQTLSLSEMTLPHRLARLFLVEQIYRAFTILRGEPYSH